MKNPLAHTVPLLLSIAIGAVVSWVSIYVFWFAIWTFHSVPVARMADAVGELLLLPGRTVFNHLGADQSAIFYDPISFCGTNGLILGLGIYTLYHMARIWRETRASPQQGAVAERREEAKVG